MQIEKLGPNKERITWCDGTVTINKTKPRIDAMINTARKYELTGYNRAKAWILWFGAMAPTRLLVFASHLEDALNECVDWIADNAPGLLCNDEVNEAYQEAKNEGMTDDHAWDHALSDVTTAGNCGDHILSWDWGIVAEDLTPKQIANYYHGRE